jgi:hypothetical protein
MDWIHLAHDENHWQTQVMKVRVPKKKKPGISWLAKRLLVSLKNYAPWNY